MKHTSVFFIIFILMLSVLQGFLVAEPILGRVTTFDDNSSSKTIIFHQDAQTNKIINISIPYKAVVTNSSFDVHTVFNASGNYSYKPQIDVGSDSDFEWAFDGTGYGRFGKQDVFSNDEPFRSIFFDGKVKYANDVKIILPKNASVSSATMNVTGRGGGGVVINEIFTSADWVEIYNYGPKVDLSNWTWYWHDQRSFSGVYKIPSGFILNTRSFVIIDESSGTNNATYLYMGSNMMWTATSSSGIAGEIRDDKGKGVDFFRCSGDTINPTAPTKWSSPDVSYPVTNDVGYRKSDFDSDNGTDWAVGGSSTKARLNPGQTGIGSMGSNGPENATVNVGDNGGDPELNHSGIYNVSTFLPDFSAELNALLQSTQVTFTDEYGTDFVEIALNISANKSGAIILSDLDICYNLTTKVFLNPHNGNLTNELNEMIPDTGEGNITLPINIRSGSAGGINITNISIDYFIPELTNDRLLVDGREHGTICYADYKNYIFQVNVTNHAGIADVENVTLTLDNLGESIKLRWCQDNFTFLKIQGPHDMITFDLPNCTSTALDAERWSLNFSVRFEWAYLSEEFKLCMVNTTNDTGSSVENEFDHVYRVENDLDFFGDLKVTGQYQGKLTDGGWVRANEKITWSNLTVVYEGTSNIYPDDKNFNITLTDDESGSWVNSSSSGKKFIITTISDSYTDHDNQHNITITNIPPEGQAVSKWTFKIRTDNDKPTIPPNVLCHADSSTDPQTTIDDDSTIYVTWDSSTDGAGSGVGSYAMEFNNNIPTAVKKSGDSANGVEGNSTFYVRARDKVGNWGSASSDSIDIDLTDVSFTLPTPDPEMWHNTTNVECGILISDLGGSGVRSDSIYYRYVEEGSILTGSWIRYQGANSDSEQILCKVNITFKSDGVNKKIQWRAIDVANNYATDPNYNTIKIDSKPIIFDGFSMDFNDWHYTRTPEITFYANDSIPEDDECSGVDINSLMYQFSTSGLDNYSDWLPITSTTTGSIASVKCTVTPEFEEGKTNYIRFKGNDNVANEFITEDYGVKVDTEKPIFSNPIPNEITWSNSTKVQYNITITELSSYLDIESIRYSFSTAGTKNYGKWNLVQIKHLTKPFYQSVRITTNITLKEGDNNYIRWLAYDTAGNSIISDDYQILVDVTGCTFHNPNPTPNAWVNTESQLCSIIINDTFGSGIDTNSIEYAISSTGPNNLGKWIGTGILTTNLSDSDAIGGSELYGPRSLHAHVPIHVFREGSQNYISWRATDLAGNEYSYGGPYKVQIDFSPLYFTNPKPDSKYTQIDPEQNCKITIKDTQGGSGVEPNSVEYRYSTSGMSGYGEWLSKGVSQVKIIDGYKFLVYVYFEPGSANYIQWRAKDVAGNGPYESVDYNITINSEPLPIISSPQHFENQSYDYTNIDTIEFNAQKTIDPDINDVLSFYWESNILGPIGFSNYFRSELPSGNHQITLYVSDGTYHNVSTQLNITVARYQMIKDLDADGIPDHLDPDIDNDGYLNDYDAFPDNKTEWRDTDLDGIGDNEDTDDDNDGHLDENDEYPLDSTRWKKEVQDNSILYILIGIIVIILIIILAVFIMVRGLKKKKEMESKLASIEPSAAADSTTFQPVQTPVTVTQPMTQLPAALSYQQPMTIPLLHPYQPAQPQPGVFAAAPMQTMAPQPPVHITPVSPSLTLPPPNIQPATTQPIPVSIPQQQLIQPQMHQSTIPRPKPVPQNQPIYPSETEVIQIGEGQPWPQGTEGYIEQLSQEQQTNQPQQPVYQQSSPVPPNQPPYPPQNLESDYRLTQKRNLQRY
jgi:hypothetical protein